MKLYIDGAKDNEKTSTLVTNVDATIDNLFVGRYSHDAMHFVNGSIDQPRIHNRALSAKEVMDYYINPWQVYLDEDE